MVDKDGRRPNLDRLLVFALGGKAKLPPAPAAQPMVLDPPALTASAQRIEAGRAKYARYCAVCHGYDAVSLGNQPDLRYSPLLGDDAWFAVLLEGALGEAGMASFADVLDRDGADEIRQYLIAKAHEAKKQKPGTAPTKPVEHSS